jgi:hypothetical protein
MSQFNSNNFGNFGPGTYDPVSELVPGFGTRNPRQNQGSSGGARRPAQGQQQQQQPMNPFARLSNVPVQAAPPRQQAFKTPNLGRYMGMGANQPGVLSGMTPLSSGQDAQRQQFINWDQALAGAMGTDMRNQQGSMNQQFGEMRGQIGQYEDALQRGLGTLQSVGAGQRDTMRGLATGAQAQGQQGFEEFKAFRDQQMGRVDQDISKSNQFAAQATENYQQAISQFQDTSAQDAANAAFGMRRSAQEQLSQINMLDVDEGQKAALRQQLSQDVGNQVTQTVTGIYGNMNQTLASMRGNLSSLMGAQSQTALGGGQLRGQMGTSFGAQTLEAQQSNQRMMELGINLRTMGEQAYASAMQQSVALELQGRTTVAQMIQENPRQFVSMFAGLTGYLAGATTPGIGQIGIPNFGAMA